MRGGGQSLPSFVYKFKVTCAFFLCEIKPGKSYTHTEKHLPVQAENYHQNTLKTCDQQ